MRRSFVMTAAVALLTPTAMLARTSSTAEFVSGTVKSIPANTTGSLDAGSSELSFHYKKSVFSVPYASITSTEVTEPTGHHLWKVPVPKLGKGPRFLNITYRDGGDSRMLTFKASASEVTSLVDAIHKRQGPTKTVAAAAPPPAPAAPATPKHKSKSKAKETAAAAPTPDKPASSASYNDAWWGDKYWRTNRNKEKWPQVPAESSPGVPGGTKE